ncbi:MAG: NAD-dependent epimerase/dehydratase family protein [Candidatus Heimdallarchaeota archaeon]|nr:NAD-dependent epimerase/dehydratase family protein [Candidatus Heimdallarchaeota archaeon]
MIHLAAQPGVRSSFENPQAMKNDISGTINVLEFIRKIEVQNYIFSSSSSIYGNSSVPFNEASSIPNPISPYAAMKLSCEVFNQMYYNQYGINTYNLRLFTVYGPRQRPDMGIYKFVNSISKNQKIKMFGNGVSSRDYTYISDLIQAIQLIMQKMDGCKTINIGSGRSVKLSDLIQLIGEKLDIEPVVEDYPEQQGDVSDTCAEITLASEYGYTPSVSIEKGIELFIDWYKNENLNSS